VIRKGQSRRKKLRQTRRKAFGRRDHFYSPSERQNHRLLGTILLPLEPCSLIGRDSSADLRFGLSFRTIESRTLQSTYSLFFAREKLTHLYGNARVNWLISIERYKSITPSTIPILIHGKRRVFYKTYRKPTGNAARWSISCTSPCSTGPLICSASSRLASVRFRRARFHRCNVHSAMEAAKQELEMAYEFLYEGPQRAGQQ
jgi:hypothetical protein